MWQLAKLQRRESIKFNILVRYMYYFGWESKVKGTFFQAYSIYIFVHDTKYHNTLYLLKPNEHGLGVVGRLGLLSFLK